MTRLAVFGSIARHDTSTESNIDLLVDAPVGTSSFGYDVIDQERTWLTLSVDLPAWHASLRLDLES